jgi:hypothetical protein
MKAAQILEKVEVQFPSPYDAHAQVRVFKNPNYLEMHHALMKSSFLELRGLVYNLNVVYVWDANLATHDDVIQVLALPEGVFWRFLLDDSDQIISADPTASQEEIMQSGMIKRMLKSV